jgi:hypothetical protein
MRISILFLALLSLFTGCVTAKRCNSRFPAVASRDSIYIEKIKEIPVYVPGDTIKVSALVNCPDQELIKFENSKLKQEIKILNGRVVSNTIIKPDTVIVYVPQIESRVDVVKVPEPVKFVPKITKFFAWSGGVFYLLLVLFVAYKIFKPKIL